MSPSIDKIQPPDQPGLPAETRERLAADAREGATDLIYARWLGRLEAQYERLLGDVATALEGGDSLQAVAVVASAAASRHVAEKAEFAAFLAEARGAVAS